MIQISKLEKSNKFSPLELDSSCFNVELQILMD